MPRRRDVVDRACRERGHGDAGGLEQHHEVCVVMLEDGKITGGDTVIAYKGSCSQAGDEFSADISTNRHTPGQSSVFGIDNVDITLVGKSTRTMASCRGTSRQAPGIHAISDILGHGHTSTAIA